MESTNTRSQILDEAQDLIQKNGVNAMSYADISKAIGIRKASIHYYFPAKEDLITDLLNRHNMRFCDLAESVLASTTSPEAQLKRYCGIFEATLQDGEQDKACLCGILSAEIKTLSNVAVEQVIQFYRHNENYLTQILQSGLEKGDFNFKGSPKIMAKLIFSLLEGDLLIARANGGVTRMNKTVEQLMSLIKN